MPTSGFNPISKQLPPSLPERLVMTEQICVALSIVDFTSIQLPSCGHGLKDFFLIQIQFKQIFIK